MTEQSIRMFQVFRALHFVGFGMWLSGLFTASYFLLFRNQEQDGPFRTRVAKMAKGTAVVADIGATMAIVGGIYQAQFLHVWKMHWLHAKLTLVVLVVAFHVFLRIRARKATEADPTPFPAVGIRVLGILIMLITVLAVFKPFH
jgi:putative membrane protein